MKSFFNTFLACLLALVTAGVMCVLLVGFVALIAGTFFVVESSSIDQGSVLRITLREPLVEDPTPSPFSLAEAASLAQMRLSRPLVLADVLHALEYARSDSRIKGIYLQVDPGVNLGLVTLDELRAALQKFRDSGKFIVSYSDTYSQRSYYLSSVAGRVLLNPEGDVAWYGMSSGVLFYKGLLDKLGVQAEAIRVGAYKSAVEPFVTDRMSTENRMQTEVMIRSLWGGFVHNVARSRAIDSTLLQSYASELKVADASAALRCRMVDSLCYGEDADSLLLAMSGVHADAPRYVSLGEYIASVRDEVSNHSKNKIGLLYADGQIIDGESMEGMVGSATLARELADMEADSAVKAVVLRINSPGGSALAAEVIWNAAERLRRHKPLIVSMGNVAASGGYYIASDADIILASRATLTGSIGVFGLMFNGEQGLKDKLGITADVVKSNPSADMQSTLFGAVALRPLTDPERVFIQKSVDRVYHTFVRRVARGRNLSEAEVDSIAGGRVWSGEDALRVGLIDGYGGLCDALLLAADRAAVGTDYQVVSPANDEPFWMQLTDLFSTRVTQRSPLFDGEFGSMYEAYARLKMTLSSSRVQALCTQWIDMP